MGQNEQQPGEFDTLMGRVRQGDEAAAWDLVELYGPHVIRVIRRHLAHEIRSKFDSDDFAQAVWASFFAAPDRYGDMEHPNQLVGLLVTMARNKVIDEVRRRMKTQKYAVQRERRYAGRSSQEDLLRARDGTPSQMAVARERWLAMLNSQPEVHRRVVRLKLMGRTHRSIAQTLQISERTVQRVIERLSHVEPDRHDD